MTIKRDLIGDVIAVLGGSLIVASIATFSAPLAAFVAGVLLITLGVLLNRPAG